MRLSNICVLCALCTLPATHASADRLPPIVGDLVEAFTAAADGTADPSGDVTPFTHPGANGFDLDDVRFEVDPDTGRLRVGLSMADGELVGDSDGDGDADRGGRGPDSSKLGVGESMQVEFDLDGDGRADALLSIDGRTTMFGCALYDLTDTEDPVVSRCSISEISPEQPDLVIDVRRFDALRWRHLPEGDRSLAFGVRVTVDSDMDLAEPDTWPQAGFRAVCPFGGAMETCDGVDEDCDGVVDERADGACWQRPFIGAVESASAGDPAYFASPGNPQPMYVPEPDAAPADAVGDARAPTAPLAGERLVDVPPVHMPWDAAPGEAAGCSATAGTTHPGPMAMLLLCGLLGGLARRRR